MAFKFTPFPELPDVVLIEPRVFGDARGWFVESYKQSEFEAAGIARSFRQDNHSRSIGKGVLRGLHYQKDPMAQGKLVRCIVGEVFDVAVDIRRGSPTYGRWVSTILSAENHATLWVPEGFAHGFQSLTDACELAYKTTNEYSSSHDGAIRYDDPELGVAWPLPAQNLSAKDERAPLLKAAGHNFVYRGSVGESPIF